MERWKERIPRRKLVPGRSKEETSRVQVKDEAPRLWKHWTLGRRSRVPKEWQEGECTHCICKEGLGCIRERWDSSRIWRQASNSIDGIARWRRIAGRSSLGLAGWCWDCIIVCRSDNRRSCSIRCKLETVEGPRYGVPISSVQRIYLQRGCAERFGIHDLGHGHIEKPQGIGNQTVPSLVEPSSEENHEWTENQESRWKDCSKFPHGDTSTYDSS